MFQEPALLLGGLEQVRRISASFVFLSRLMFYIVSGLFVMAYLWCETSWFQREAPVHHASRPFWSVS